MEPVVAIVGAEQELVGIQLARSIKDRLPGYKHVHSGFIGQGERDK
jgi:hypothetical protein